MTDTAAQTKVTEMKRSANPKMESQPSASAPSGRAHVIALIALLDRPVELPPGGFELVLYPKESILVLQDACLQ